MKFQAGKKLIRPGISSNISILVERAEDVVSVPASAVFVEDDQRYVFVRLGEHRFERRKVEIGIGNLNFIEIRSGLNEGDEVATTRPSQSEIVGGDKDAPEGGKKRGKGGDRGNGPRGAGPGGPPPM